MQIYWHNHLKKAISVFFFFWSDNRLLIHVVWAMSRHGRNIASRELALIACCLILLFEWIPRMIAFFRFVLCIKATSVRIKGYDRHTKMYIILTTMTLVYSIMFCSNRNRSEMQSWMLRRIQFGHRPKRQFKAKLCCWFVKTNKKTFKMAILRNVFFYARPWITMSYLRL